jgi:hypothetical protein
VEQKGKSSPRMLVVLYRSPTGDASALIEKLSGKRGPTRTVDGLHQDELTKRPHPRRVRQAERVNRRDGIIWASTRHASVTIGRKLKSRLTVISATPFFALFAHSLLLWCILSWGKRAR